jgi:hypothetical protein
MEVESFGECPRLSIYGCVRVSGEAAAKELPVGTFLSFAEQLRRH